MVEYSQYKSVGEWRKGNPKDYQDAESQGYIPDLCEIFGWPKYVKDKGNGFWNLKRCVESAKGLTKSEWRKKHNSAFQSAYRNGWLEKCEMVLLPNVRTLVRTEQESHLIALKYTTLKDFIENETLVYKHASYHGWLPKITSHLYKKKVRGFYTKEECINSAKKYKYRSEWTKNESKYYHCARKNGWLDECCQHMNRKSKWEDSNIWVKKICIEDAQNYKSKEAWKEKNKGSYLTAKKMGVMKECTKHMK